MENYYDVLGLPFFEDRHETILSAYRENTKKLCDTIHDSEELERRLILQNEAFLVLWDINVKPLYDHCLGSHSEKKELVDAISSKREKAISFVRSKLPKARKNSKRSILPAILCGMFLLSALGTIFQTCVRASIEESMEHTSQEIGSFTPDSSWSEYEIDNSFRISVPRTMELRKEYDAYMKLLKENHLSVSNADAVFQQANLGGMSSKSFDTYCRVMTSHIMLSPDDVEHHNQSSFISVEDRENLKKMVDAEVEPFTYVVDPAYQWIDVSGTKALEAKSVRTGVDGSVTCRLYVFPNYDEMAKILIAYRTSDAELWKTDMENIVRTFKWDNPK